MQELLRLLRINGFKNFIVSGGDADFMRVWAERVYSEREYAYDAKTKSTGKLVEALKEAAKRGWIVVDMKQDWNTIFRPESK